MNRQEMLRRVQALGFVVVDVGLYLNTHPNDTAALNFYSKYNALYEQAKEEFEESFGPLCMTNVEIEVGWSWIEKPWPWELEG